MTEKLKTLTWFAARPSHWSHAFALATRKLRQDFDSSELRAVAKGWAQRMAVPEAQALTALGFTEVDQVWTEWTQLDLRDAEHRVADTPLRMGGPGALGMLYSAVRLLNAGSVVETGVAYGWSSLAILSAMHAQGHGRLVSVDMPYPKLECDDWVGVAVPDSLRSEWTVLRRPDRYGLKHAIGMFDQQIDLCHYDSDKSWYGRMFAYPIIWRALRSGGLFISDDIQDNLAFKEFAGSLQQATAVVEFQGKFVGLIRKP